jgi:glycine/D-amino acid oxidase-like deaminating enzyme
MIGADPDVAGLWYATGHGRKGVLLGPITGEIIRDLMLDGKTAWDVSSCSVTRFD